MGFWKNGKVISRNKALDKLLDTDSVTLKIANHTNRCMRQTLQQESIDTKGAMAYLSHRVHHILSNGDTEDNLLCDICCNGSWKVVTSGNNFCAFRISYKTLKVQ